MRNNLIKIPLFLYLFLLQEVTLRKNNNDERIGLTVSYSSGNGSGSGSDDADTCTEVYISDILVDSVAARDGRLRQGDQILQVSIQCTFFCFHVSDYFNFFNPVLWIIKRFIIVS